jgi:RNA polymerase sigma-70 factor (ECF subfamily)
MTDARFHTVWIPLQERFYRVAFYILEDRADALDAVQDLYVKLWKMRDSLDLVRNPGAYDALLMRNLCIDRIRRLAPAGELSDDLPGREPPDEELIRKESLGQLLRSMETLPESQRKLLGLHVLQGKSYEEIAAETGLSPLNVRVQVSLARKKLKRHEEHR